MAVTRRGPRRSEDRVTISHALWARAAGMYHDTGQWTRPEAVALRRRVPAREAAYRTIAQLLRQDSALCRRTRHLTIPVLA
jgi:hypothetical protein